MDAVAEDAAGSAYLEGNDDNSDVFNVTFEAGPLGIGLKSDELRFASVYAVDGFGQGAKLGIKKGDIIAAVDGEVSTTYMAALALIESKPRPVVISFAR